MTRFTPLWQQAGVYPANYDRALLAALWPTPGGLGAAPTPVANTMNVSIPPGVVAVPLQSGQHTALCRWDAAEVVTSPAPPASGQSRIDLVIAQVRDPALDSGVNNDFLFVVVAGAPAASNPVAPAVPTNAAAVCQYTVVGGTANLNGVTIVERRPALGPPPVFNTTTERDALYPNPIDGAMCRTLDSRQPWLRSGGAWHPPLWTYRGSRGYSAMGTAVGYYDVLVLNIPAVPVAVDLYVMAQCDAGNDSQAIVAGFDMMRLDTGAVTEFNGPYRSQSANSYCGATMVNWWQVPKGNQPTLKTRVNFGGSPAGGTFYAKSYIDVILVPQ